MPVLLSHEVIDELMNLYVSRLIEELGDNLLKVVLFGSCARGDYEIGSDIDVFVLVRDYSSDIKNTIDRLTSDFDLRYEAPIADIVKKENVYNKYYYETLYQNIRREGIVYFDKVGERENFVVTDQDKIEMSKVRMEHAYRCLEEAEQVIKTNSYLLCVNRTYYAAYYAIRALLVLEHTEMTKHYGNLSEFRRYYIRTKIFKVEYSDFLEDLFKTRNYSDYEPLFVLTASEAETRLEYAKEIVHDIAKYLKGYMHDQ